MFGAALTIAYNIFFKAEDLFRNLDKQTEKQIEAQLRDSDGRVLLGIASKDIKRGKNDVFGIGIKNQLNSTEFFTVAG